MLTRTIDHYREETKETLVSTCGLFGVNRQVYYRRKKAAQRNQETASKVVDLVMEVRQQMPRIGTRKIYYLLKDQLKDLGVGRDKLFAILRANHMLVKPARSYRKTTDTHHRFRKHKNLIEQLTPTRPEQVWVSDLTYLGKNGSHQYLALVTDVYSKKIVGHDLSNSLNAEGALKALKMGLKQRAYKDKELIATLHPRQDFYLSYAQSVTVPAVRSTVSEDFYVILVGWESVGQDQVTFKIYLNPLINWLWGGAILLIFGTMVAGWPDKRTQPVASAAYRPGMLLAEKADAS